MEYSYTHDEKSTLKFWLLGNYFSVGLNLEWHDMLIVWSFHASRKGDGANNVQVSKKDLQFNLKIKVTLHDLVEVQSAYKGKEIFCTFGVSQP